MLDGLTGIPLASQQDGVGASGCTSGELIEGQNFSASLEDALASRRRETKSSNGKFGDFQQANIVGYGADDDDDFGIPV